MSLLQRVRDNGRGAPPSLLGDERNVGDVAFDALIVRILDLSAPNSISLGSDPQVATDFKQVLESCKSIDSIPGEIDSTKKVAALEQRRCVVLAIIAATPQDSEPLKQILSDGLLTSLRPWLDEILSSTVGGVDLLLYFLTSITALPVTKTQIRDSGMGKKVGSIEKLKICAGTPNESAIKSRIQSVKDAWNASAKAKKDQEVAPPSKKRTLDIADGIAKKTKTDDGKSSFSSLLRKVSPGKPKAVPKPPLSMKSLIGPSMTGLSQPNKIKTEIASVPRTKKSNKRVKWADHFGGNLEHAREIEGNNGEQPSNPDSGSEPAAVSWTNRLKRDRLREKELLSQAKKKKLLDDDDDDIFSPVQRMTAKVAWHPPALLPERTDVTKTPADSKELITQLGRMAAISHARYVSEHLVPNSPAQLSDVESALDMQSAQSSVPTTIPFFVPQATPIPAPAPAPLPIAMMAPAPAPYGSAYQPPPPPPPTMAVGATADMVQAMGLPLFLVGQNVQALQTVASNPSLLNTFVDAHGMYDQQNLMALVQTLGQSMPNQPPPQQQSTYGNSYAPPPAHQPYGGAMALPYGPAAVAAPPPAYGQASGGSHYGPAATSAPPVSRGFRSDQNTEANLHMAGYGPTTTQAEIIAVFSPYVRVKEVVMKNGFCFVNTMDPVGAQTAKDALTGALVGGMPIRINLAQRRSRDLDPPPPSANIYGGGGAPAAPHMLGSLGPPPPPPQGGARPASGPPANVDSVRDDRGNPATKNLFVAGYGAGTSEAQLREFFNQHAHVTGCVMKGNFSFVNTTDRSAAVVARQALMGSMVNGGVLRINFAKETGRLGTSFDLTYNSASGGDRGGGPPPQQQRSYYGR